MISHYSSDMSCLLKLKKVATSSLTFYAPEGRVKISQKPKVFSYHFLQFLFHKIYFIQYSVLQGLMKAFLIIILEPVFYAATEFKSVLKDPQGK